MINEEYIDLHRQNALPGRGPSAANGQTASSEDSIEYGALSERPVSGYEGSYVYNVPTASRSLRRSWMALALGLLFAVLLIQGARHLLLFNLEEAGLAGMTTTVFGDGETGRVHCTDRRDEAACLNAYHRAGSPPAALWLGNSQLHAVNRYRPGQETAPMRLHRALMRKGLYLVTFSEPNANLDEHLYVFRRLTRRYHITTLLLPVSLNQFRETGIRETLKDPERSGARQLSGKSVSVQANVEHALTALLFSNLQVWRDREGLQGGLNYLSYVLLHKLLGITAQSKRVVSQTSYSEKMATLEVLLSEANRAGIHVILYVPPYRRDVPNPYDRAQYAAFRRDVAIAAARHHARFLDLTDIVPGPDWGMLRDPIFGVLDYDFMHFTAEGHRRLSEYLLKAF